jgi:chemotaxis protein histidine kinase CheA
MGGYLPMESSEYRELFIEEAREHINDLTKSLLVLEKNSENIEVVFWHDGLRRPPRPHPCNGGHF